MSAPAPSGPGRPRDPDVDRRALAAARSLYGMRGWSGFTLEQVAKVSGIGKGSLYLRWPTKATLIVAAVRDAAPPIGEIDTGAVRTDLVEFGVQWMRFILSDAGSLMLRLSLERRYVPEIEAAFGEQSYADYVGATRAIVRRGIDRGDLPPSASPSVVGDLVAGAVANHARVTPPRFLDDEHIQRYVGRLVDTVLDGARRG